MIAKGSAVTLPPQTGDLVHEVLYTAGTTRKQARTVCWRVIPQDEDVTYWALSPGPPTCLKCLSAGG